jgi:hypothetical protein
MREMIMLELMMLGVKLKMCECERPFYQNVICEWLLLQRCCSDYIYLLLASTRVYCLLR